MNDFSFEEVAKYLPQYLSRDATHKLFKDLSDFPNNIHKRLYSETLVSEGDVFQGDGISDMLVVRLPNPRINPAPVIVVSNTCDTASENQRIVSPNVIYCPIIKLSSHIASLNRGGVPQHKIDVHVASLMRQEISSIFYLPKGGKLPEDCITLLDGMNSCDISVLTPEIVISKRLFSLSNYGFYLLLYKLGIHLTRVREAVDRN